MHPLTYQEHEYSDINWLFTVILACISCNKYECTMVQDKVTGLGPKLLGHVWAYAKEVPPARTSR